MVSEQQIVELFTNLAKEESLAVTVSESVKGGVKVGVCATVGGLLGGPAGLAVGSVVGGAIAAATAKDFKPVPQVLAELTPDERRRLFGKFLKATEHLTYTDYAMLVARLATDVGLKAVLLQALKDFVMQELKMSLK